MRNKLKILDVNIMIYITAVSMWLGYSHVVKTYHIWTANQFINFEVGLPFNARFLFYSLSGYVLDLLNLPFNNYFTKLLYVLVDFFSLLLSQLLIFIMINRIYANKLISIAGIVIFSYIIAFNYIITPVHNYYYIYDLVAVVFFIFFIWSIIFNYNFNILITIIVFSTLNRETSFLMPLTYLLLMYKSETNKKLILKFLLLSLSWVIVKIFISYYMTTKGLNGGIVSFYDETGGLRLIRNIKVFLFLLPLNSLAFYSSFGFLYIFIFKYLKKNDRFFNVIYLFLFYLFLMMFVGNIDEIRIFSENIIFIVLLISSILNRIIIENDISI